MEWSHLSTTPSTAIQARPKRSSVLQCLRVLSFLRSLRVLRILPYLHVPPYQPGLTGRSKSTAMAIVAYHKSLPADRSISTVMVVFARHESLPASRSTSTAMVVPARGKSLIVLLYLLVGRSSSTAMGAFARCMCLRRVHRRKQRQCRDYVIGLVVGG
jgi:hypothetical protein